MTESEKQLLECCEKSLWRMKLMAKRLKIKIYFIDELQKIITKTKKVKNKCK